MLRRARRSATSSSAVMSCMLPTATLRYACCAVFILPNITALLLLAGCRSSQWQRRITAIARHHKAIAWLSPPARSCTAASRCTWWPPRLTARPPLESQGFGKLPCHTISARPTHSAVMHSGQSFRSFWRHITTLFRSKSCISSQCAQLGFAMRRSRRVTSPVLRKCQSVTTARPCGVR